MSDLINDFIIFLASKNWLKTGFKKARIGLKIKIGGFKELKHAIEELFRTAYHRNARFDPWIYFFNLTSKNWFKTGLKQARIGLKIKIGDFKELEHDVDVFLIRIYISDIFDLVEYINEYIIL